MASSLGSLVVRLGLDAGDYTSALLKAEKNAQRFSGQVEQSFKNAGRAAKETADAVNYLGRGLQAVVAAFGVRELSRLSDEYQNATARLQIFTQSNEELARLQGSLFGIAQNTRQSLSATVDLYYQLANATQDVGTSQAQLLQITSGVNKGLIISGSVGDSAKGVIIQLSQALAAGKLRGQEFNTVNEQGNRIMRAVGEGLGLTVGQLRELANAGDLTTELFVRGFTKGLASLEQDFNKIPVTITGALQIAQNELQQFLGTTLQSTGQSNVFAQAILLVAKNINTLAAATAGFLTYKIADVVLTSVAAFEKQASAVIASAAAVRAETAVKTAAIAAEIERLRATEATIVAARAQTIAELQAANAIGVKTAASKAAAALAVNDLAMLGRAQAANTAQLVAMEASLASTAARTGFLSRAIAALGGPIGAVATALGLGVTAWQIWGNSASDAAAKAALTTEASTTDILKALDKQIQRLKERNGLRDAAPGVTPDGPAAEQAASLLARIDKLKQSKDRSDLVLAIDLQGQYDDLLKKMEEVNVEKDKITDADRTKKASEWLKTYATDAERLAEELKKARAELGDKFTPELEKRIREKFAKKPEAGADDSRKILDGQLKALEAGLAREKDLLTAYENFLRDTQTQGLVSVKDYYDNLQRARDENLRSQLQVYEDQLTAAEIYYARAKKQTDKQEALNKIDEIRSKRTNLLRDAGIAEQALNRERVRAEQDYSDLLSEINAKILELNGNTEAATRIRLDAANRVVRNLLQSAAVSDPAAQVALNQQAALEKQAVLQAGLNDASKQYGLIIGDLEIAQERLNIAVATGMVTELDGMFQSAKLTSERLDKLKKIADEYERIAALSKDPADLLKAAQMRVAIEKMEGSLDAVAKKFNDIFANEFANALTDVVTGAKSVKDAFNDMARSITQAITRIAAQNLAEALFGKGGPTGGGFGTLFSKLFSGGDVLGWLSSLFGGGGGLGYGTIGSNIPAGPFPYANGTSFHPGGMALIGENGPELVSLPRGSKVTPSDKTRAMLGGQMVFNVNVMPGADTRSAKQVGGVLRDTVIRAIKDR